MTIKTSFQRIITSTILLAFVLLPMRVFALDWVETQPVGNTTASWRAVSSDTDGSNLIAASFRLYTSTDGGANWTERQPEGDTTHPWKAVASDADGSNLIAVYGAAAGDFPAEGRIYTSTDGGANWTERQPAGDVDLEWRAAASDADGSNLIVGVGTDAEGRLYTSTDGGANWTERQPAGDVDVRWASVASDADGSNLIAAAQTGRLYTSTDGGANWTERQPAGDFDLGWSSVASDADGSNLVAAVNSGRLYTSSDGGANWTERQPAGDVNRAWTAIASDADGSYLVAGVFNGRLYVSGDGGENWDEEQPEGAANKFWQAVASDDNGSNLFVGINGGRLYVYAAETTPPTISSLDPADDATGVATGYFADSGATIEFDETVVAGTGSVTIYDASDDSVVAIYDVEDQNYVTTQDNVAYIYTEQEEVLLERETTYYILIDEGAFEDMSGNPFAGIDDETTWNFTTQLNPTVIIDEDFTTGDGFLVFEDTSYVESFAVQDDGKILVGGYFNLYDNDEIGFGIARLNTDGSLDETFVTGDGFDDWVQSLALQTDGKILVGGGFTTYDNATSTYITRLNADGSLDDTFMMGDGFNGNVQDIAIQDDGKIVIVGYFDGYNGSGTGYGIVRLNTDGTIDEDFVTGVGFNDSPETVHIQDDGKILVGGYFDGYAGDLFGFGLARLNTDGSLDETFVTGDGFDDGVEFITTDADGNIVLTGGFSTYDGSTANIIARLNTDGSLDETFVTGDGFLFEGGSGTVYEIAIDGEGKIVVVGYFDEYDGNSTGYGIARLNTDGSLDNTFTTGDGFGSSGELFALTLQDDGKILAGGYFEEYDGDTVGFGIARLIPPGDEEEPEPEPEEEEEESPSRGGGSSSHRRSSSVPSTPPPTGASAGSVEALMQQLIVLLQQLLEQLIAEQQGN